MLGRHPATLLVLILLSLPVAAIALPAQTGGDQTPSTTADGDPTYTPIMFQCGSADLTLSSPNPFAYADLDNGIVNATGSFLLTVETEGGDGPRVSEVHLGWGHTFPWPFSMALCTGPYPTPGAYHEAYRVDNDGTDGWTIPINTRTVPDMAYGVVVRALDHNGHVLKTAFLYVNVNNHENDLDWLDANCVHAPCYQDETPPYPATVSAPGVGCAGTALAFGEPLASIAASQGTLTPVTAPTFDDDALPLFTVSDTVWGPAYCWTGAGTGATVTAQDGQGNVGVFPG